MNYNIPSDYNANLNLQADPKVAEAVYQQQSGGSGFDIGSVVGGVSNVLTSLLGVGANIYGAKMTADAAKAQAKQQAQLQAQLQNQLLAQQQAMMMSSGGQQSNTGMYIMGGILGVGLLATVLVVALKK